ncbi:hypothetical protein [Pseudomonas koreensis]|uniref:hypothetical protein n=1 Tax=Pseudomonas koreensis TaxID=198620 RepID=UPI002076EA66|nr:hypothetical protein [Pseudomonas koreensis]MCM8743442.1 hypothetical protein [Pseudomonas koreensis]
MYLYHGTLGAKKHRFEAFCHFGTRAAAVERIARRLIDGHQGDPVILKLRFKFDEGQVLKIEDDWGSNQPIAAARALKDYFKEKDSEKYSIFEEIRCDLVAAKVAGQEFRQKGWEQLSKALQKIGICAIGYRNMVEDAGGYSYCVVEPTRRICVGTSRPTHQELEEAKAVARSSMGNAI